MIGLLGRKLGHTRAYDGQGNLVPVTVVKAGPNRVLRCKTIETDGYEAVQLGFGEQKIQRLPKPILGQLVKAGAVESQLAKRAREKDESAGRPTLVGVSHIREFRDFSKPVKPGDLLGADLFAPGDFVDAIGVTKGRGFEGVVRRHGFRGGDMTHGAKGWHRRPGAIGQRLFPGTIRRGLRMPGHLGQVRRTTQNLEVVQVLPEDNLLLIKGAIPGAEGSYVVIREAKKLSRAVMAARRQAKAEAASKSKDGAKGGKPAAKAAK